MRQAWIQKMLIQEFFQKVTPSRFYFVQLASLNKKRILLRFTWNQHPCCFDVPEYIFFRRWMSWNFFHKIWEKVMFLYFLMNTNWNLYYAVILDSGEDPNFCWGDLSKTEGNGAWRKASLRLPFPSRTCFAASASIFTSWKPQVLDTASLVYF